LFACMQTGAGTIYADQGLLEPIIIYKLSKLN